MKKIIGNIIYGSLISVLILGGLYNIISTPLDWLYCLKHGYRMECSILSDINNMIDSSQEMDEITTDEIHKHEWQVVVGYEWISHGDGKGHIVCIDILVCSCGLEKR